MPTRDQVVEVAKKCFDPEIPVNIWDLGLIYEIEAQPEKIKIQMTLTTQHCPAAKAIPEDFKKKLVQDLKVEDITIDIVFDPVWTPERINEEGKKKLGITPA